MHEDEAHETDNEEDMPFSRRSVLYGLLPPTRSNVRHARKPTGGAAPKAYAQGVLEEIDARRKQYRGAGGGAGVAVPIGMDGVGEARRSGHQRQSSAPAESKKPFSQEEAYRAPHGGIPRHRRSAHRILVANRARRRHRHAGAPSIPVISEDSREGSEEDEEDETSEAIGPASASLGSHQSTGSGTGDSHAGVSSSAVSQPSLAAAEHSDGGSEDDNEAHGPIGLHRPQATTDSSSRRSSAGVGIPRPQPQHVSYSPARTRRNLGNTIKAQLGGAALFSSTGSGGAMFGDGGLLSLNDPGHSADGRRTLSRHASWRRASGTTRDCTLPRDGYTGVASMNMEARGLPGTTDPYPKIGPQAPGYAEHEALLKGLRGNNEMQRDPAILGQGDPSETGGATAEPQGACCSSGTTLVWSETLMRLVGILPWWGERASGMPRVAFVIYLLAIVLILVWMALPPLARYFATVATNRASDRGDVTDWEQIRFGYSEYGSSYDPESLGSFEWNEGEDGGSSKAADSAWFAAVQSVMLQLAILLPWHSMVGARAEFALGKRFRARLTKAVVELEDEFEDDEAQDGFAEGSEGGDGAAVWQDEDGGAGGLGDAGTPLLSEDLLLAKQEHADRMELNGGYEPPSAWTRQEESKNDLHDGATGSRTRASGLRHVASARPRSGSGDGIFSPLGSREYDNGHELHIGHEGATSSAGDLHVPLSAAQHHKSSALGKSEALRGASKKNAHAHHEAEKMGWGARKKAHKHHGRRRRKKQVAAPGAMPDRRPGAAAVNENAASIGRSITGQLRPHSSSAGQELLSGPDQPLLAGTDSTGPISRHSSIEYPGAKRPREAAGGDIDRYVSGTTAESSATSFSGSGDPRADGSQPAFPGEPMDGASERLAAQLGGGEEQEQMEAVLSPACTHQLKAQSFSAALAHVVVTSAFGLAIVFAWLGCAIFQLEAATGPLLPGGLPPMVRAKGAEAGLLPVRSIGLLPWPQWVRLTIGIALVGAQVLVSIAGCIGLFAFALLCSEARLQLDQLTFEMVDAHTAASAEDDAKEAAEAFARDRGEDSFEAALEAIAAHHHHHHREHSAHREDEGREEGGQEGGADAGSAGSGSATGSEGPGADGDDRLSIATASSGGSFREQIDEAEASEIQEMLATAHRATQHSSLLSSGDAAEALLSAYQSAAHFIYRMSEANGSSVGASVVLSFVLLLCVLIDTVSQTDEAKKGPGGTGAKGAWGSHFVLLAALCLWMMLPLYCVALIAERSHVFQRDSAMAVVSSPAFGKTTTGEKTLLGAYLNGTQPSLRLLGVEISMETVKEVSILLIGALTVVLKLLFSVDISLG